MMLPPQTLQQVNPQMGSPMTAQQSPSAIPPQQPSMGAPQQQQQLDPKIQQLLMQLAGMGRNGDTLLAHLTPGEMEVPKEVQTPKVLATLNKAYKDAGVSPQQFTAGSPQSSTNPQTGLNEYNFMAAFLPAALGIAGSIAMPYLAPEAMSALAASSIGGGIGSTLGGLAAGEKPTQALLSGAGAAAGGYGMGSLAGGGAANMANQAAMQGANVAPGAASQAASAAADASASFPAQQAANNGWQTMGGLMKTPINPMQSVGAALGGYAGGALGAPGKTNPPLYPPGFNTPMHSLNTNYQAMLGNTGASTTPNFTGFNPATNYPGAFNFFPRS